mgnify:CR=1 FL=1
MFCANQPPADISLNSRVWSCATMPQSFVAEMQVVRHRAKYQQHAEPGESRSLVAPVHRI